MQHLKEKKVYVFDMDGTLYHGMKHYNYYARLIQKALPEQKQLPFMEDYQAIMEHRHPIQIGMIYDLKRDVGIEIHPTTWEIEKVVTWNGDNWSESKVREVYGDARINLEDKTLLAIGDAWWVPFICSMHHHGDVQAYEKYFETKVAFNKNEETYELPRNLKEGLFNLKQHAHVVCMTNSEEKDMHETLRALGIEDCFDAFIPDAKKPYRTAEHLKRLKDTLDIEWDEMVSVGDNYLNEIEPALTLGMYGVHIWNTTPKFTHDKLTTVATLDDLFG